MRLLKCDFGDGDADALIPRIPASQSGFVVGKALAPSAVPPCLSSQLRSGPEQAASGEASRFAGEQAPGGLSPHKPGLGQFLPSSLKRAFSVQLFSIGVSEFQAAETCVASHFPNALSLGWWFWIVSEKKSMFLKRFSFVGFLLRDFVCHRHRGSSRCAVFVCIPGLEVFMENVHYEKAVQGFQNF